MRGGLRNALLACASAGLFFGAAEIALRLTGLAPSRALRSPDLRTLDAIPGLFEPGQDFTDRVRRDLPSHIRINNLGFRGRDLPEARPASARRVLCLGDSYTFGDHVNDDEAYPALLQAALRAASPAAGYEVVNGGANGFGVLDEERFWIEKADRVDPNLVIVTFSPNDISDLTRPALVYDQMREHAAVKSRPVVGPLLRFLQDTACFNALQILAARGSVAMKSHDAIPRVEPSRAGPDAAPEAWEAYHRALVAFGGALGRRGRASLLVLYPSCGNVSGEDRSFASDRLPGWAAEAGIPFLDLLPAFRDAARAGSPLFLVPADAHPSPAGHAVAARAIARRLLEGSAAPPPPERGVGP
ncbi:MAG: SGNH/GDSL hydrolase family protein [Acidobacteria bacterium]|nr:SGNH/GDSL hydrolase family protein [Acidobacteriota bacterium]